jgi:uncharacterized membrane protein required for colicin V production
MNILDLVIPFLWIGGILLCFRRAFLRSLISVFTLFISFVIASLLYTPIISWLGRSVTSSGTSAGSNGGSVVFGGLVIVFFALLETMISRNYPDTRIHALKGWDHILGGAVGILWSTLAVSLILLIIEYGSLTIGAQQTSGLSALLAQSKITLLFRQFFNLPLSVVKLMYPNGLPDILRHFAR